MPVTKNILLIGDDPGLLQVLGDIIQNNPKNNCGPTKTPGGPLMVIGETTAAAEGENPVFGLFMFNGAREALDWCGVRNPDLVVVDYPIPGMDGLQFIERFRAMPDKKDIPVIMLTGVSESEIRYRALEKGVSDFVSRPVDRLEFGLRINNWLAWHRRNRELAGQAKMIDILVEKAVDDILKREQEVIFRLSKAVEYREMETGGHIIRVACYTRCIAKALGLSDNEQNLLFKTAPLHDIGKIGIPDRILRKTGNLNKEEYEIMKQHTLIGYRILQGSPSPLLETAAEIALTHHEKYNGSGYPRGLTGVKIPLYGRIMGLADVFDALTTPRGDKKAWEVEAAFEYIRDKSGKHFDPECVRAFLAEKDNIPAVLSNYGGD